MAKAKNKVIEGDYKRCLVVGGGLNGTPRISRVLKSSIKLTRKYVKEYEVMDSDVRKSGASAVGRAAVGSFFLGPVGLLAGAGAKNKGIHLIAVEFNDGKRSLIEVDQNLYKAIMKSMF